jgi:hypothetical protein
MGYQSAHGSRVKVFAVTLLVLIVGVTGNLCAGESNTARDLSRFLYQLEKEEYIETKPPAETPVFRWDFSHKDVHSYTFEQEVRNKTFLRNVPGGQSGDQEQRMSAKGSLLIKSQGDGTAELVLQNLKVSAKMEFGKEREPKTVEQTMPPVVVQGMREDGSGSFDKSSRGMLLELLFPLPNATLNLGEFVDIPAQRPFNAMGSLLQVTGRYRITLTRYVIIGKHRCAQFDVDIDISDLRIPAELEGEYKFSTNGASVHYFDVAERRFVSGTTATLVQFTIDAPMPKMNIPGKETTDLPKTTKMSMASDNLIRVSLKE